MGPSATEIKGVEDDTEVTFAPMDALADGLGGLDTSRVRPISEVARRGYNYFREGDVLLAKVTPCFQNGKKTIASGLLNGLGYATSEVYVLRPNPDRMNTRFLFYLLCSEEFRAHALKSMTGAGGLRRISEDGVLNYRPKITDLSAQKAFADFLDRETARINQLIEKKKRLVVLLKEKRSALITVAVTGRSAEGGVMMPIKHAARFLNGAAFKPSDWGDTGLPILRIAQLTGKPFDNYFDGIINRGLIIRDNDLLFSWSATIDAFIWNRGDAILNQHIFKVIPKSNSIKKYLFYIIKAHAPRWAEHDAHGSTMRHIKKESLSNKVWIPDLDTQKAIADFLDRETGRIDQIIEKTQQTIDRLKEFRSALITAAVAGRIDVTSWNRQGRID